MSSRPGIELHGRTVRVLIVEDNASVAASVVGALNARGIETRHAADLAASRAALATEEFDAILCDYDLPDGVGTAFLDSPAARTVDLRILWSGLDRGQWVDRMRPPQPLFFLKDIAGTRAVLALLEGLL